MSKTHPTILCLASYFKGTSFLKACHQQGGRVLLVTRAKLRDKAWPWDAIDNIFYMPDLRQKPDIFHAISYLMREEKIDRIVPLDDYDVETCAALREHLRLPGIGDTQVRYFRDKLAMRQQAQAAGLPVPDFTAVFNYDRLREFMARVPPPWVLKPRSEAGAMGIKKIDHAEQLWRWLDELGDQQSHFLLEKFITAEVYHVDSLIWQGDIQLAVPHKYSRPPMSVAHHGGIFVTRRLPHSAAETDAVLAMNAQLIAAFGLQHGTIHAEFLRDENGRYYFLENAARVGGANIEQLVEASTGGINLWGEWAKMELASTREAPYQAPADAANYAAILVCLAKQKWPDLSAYQADEIVYRVNKKYHAGLVVASPSHERVEQLINDYTPRFAQDFLAVAPPLDKPPT